MLTKEQLAQIKISGLNPKEVTQQIAILRKGLGQLKISCPATVGNGITQLSDTEHAELLHTFVENAQGVKLLRFVPASGAATRMFQTLVSVHKDSHAAEQHEIKQKIAEFISRLSCYSFYPLLKNKDSLPAILKELLSKPGLNYAQMPKGLVAFHRYGTEIRTAFTEQLIEGLLVAPTNTCRMHFTVLPEHITLFKRELTKVKLKLEKKYKKKLIVAFSFQAPETNTIAADHKNEIFTDDKGKIVFRPSGHGALLSNINKLDADVILIKNIDNIAHDWRKAIVVEYEKILISYCCKLRQDCAKVLSQAKRKKVSPELLKPLLKALNIKIPVATATPAQIITLLDRPLRVCAMVKNEGEPGGGPFWVTMDGQKTLQILEKDQLNAKQKEKYLPDATHFNPVLIACSLTNALGKPFDLNNYIDNESWFISQKSHQGNPLKALERPGLWNGSMAHWNTAFVEIPNETFTPVKTVFDLIRPEHLPQEGC